MKQVDSMVDRRHIYMSGSGYYTQIKYLTVIHHHSNNVTYISSCKHYKIHPAGWCRPLY